MFLTFLDREGQFVDIRVDDVVMRQQQRATYQAPGQEDVRYVLGTRITLQSGVDIWVNTSLEDVREMMEYGVHPPDIGASSTTAFSVKVRGTGK